MAMAIAIFLSLGMLTATVCLHYCGLYRIARYVKFRDAAKHSVPIVVMTAIAVLHMVEIGLYGWVFYLLHQFTELGSFTSEFSSVASDYLYFSGANYTTFGMSDFYPTGHFKIFAVTEALAGFMMITWSATFFYTAVGKFSVSRD